MPMCPANAPQVPFSVAIEGDAILEELVQHTTAERFTLVHDWEVGDMVLWDNWRTMHCARGIPPHCQREVQRTTINSERVIGRLA